ncbi:MAG: hypothetical protein QXX55_00415 [Candidatus Pacearchaeota archaeon]
MGQSVVQLGKNKVNDNFIKTLEEHFKNHNNVKVPVLKNAERNRDKVIEYKDEILKKLGRNYTARIIGFTIFLKKWRKEVR